MKKKYNLFKLYHTGFLNAFFHFFSAFCQLYAIVFLVLNFSVGNFILCLGVVIFAPFIFDGVGHYLGGNLKEILTLNINNKTLNVLNINPVENMIFKIVNFVECIYSLIKKLCIK